MQSEIYLNNNQLYRIVNRKSLNNLTHGPQIKCLQTKTKSINQIWFIKYIRDNVYQIGNLQSAEVLTKNNMIQLEKSKDKDNQLWLIQRSEIFNQHCYFWIINIQTQQCLSASGGTYNIKATYGDRTLYCYQWEFVKINEKQQIPNICCLKSVSSGLVIEAQEFYLKDGVLLGQSTLTGAGNQRWVFQPVKNNVYFIRSLCSGLVLAYQQNNKKSQQKIIQNCFNGTESQMWKVMKTIVDTYIFQLNVPQKKYLSVTTGKENSTLILSDSKYNSQWIIVGYFDY